MESNVLDVKAVEPNDESTARLTRYWADESHGTTVGIQKFDGEITAAHLLGWLLWMRIKHSHRKITMTHTQITCPNRITLTSIAAKIYNALQRNPIEPKIEKIEKEPKCLSAKLIHDIIDFDYPSNSRCLCKKT